MTQRNLLCPARLLASITLLLLSLAVPAGAENTIDLIYGQVFTGTVGTARVSMRLWRRNRFDMANHNFLWDRKSTDRTVEGFYYYDRHRQEILLVGEADESGKIVLSEYAEPGQSPSGFFRGSLEGDRFTGTWESADHSRSVDFAVATDKKYLETPQGSRELSLRDQEAAAEAVKEKHYPKAIYYLKMARLAGDSVYTQNWEELFQAILDGRQNALREKLTACKVDWTCAYARGPLAWFAEQDGDVATAKKIHRELCLKDNPSLGLARTFTCLMYAEAGERSGDRVAALEGYDLACGPQTCAKAQGPDELALVAAARGGQWDAVDRLLDKPVNVNAQNGAALEAAVLSNDSKLIRKFLDKGADPDLGHAIDNAVVNNFDAVADLLLEHLTDHEKLASPLQQASLRGRVALVEKLIAKGADVNDNDYVGGGTALGLAAEQNHVEVVRILLDRGADPLAHGKFHDPPLQATKDPTIKKLLRDAIAQCRRGERKCEEND